jgi:protein TonB
MSMHRRAALVAALGVLSAGIALPWSVRAAVSAEEKAMAERPPAPVRMVQPEYPDPARSEGVEGTVLLRVRVDAAGVPVETEVVEGVEEHPELGEAAEKALLQWEFEPATDHGEPVEASVMVPVRFAMDGGRADDAQ